MRNHPEVIKAYLGES
ncbi:hypothetical protein [Endozoicomonas sp.]